ncbi:fimbrial protein [Serratia rubidaea]|uniref:Fimbrial protein n=1 Tax=Serratia rubidaea TaxID=61652 RepID=A0A448SKW3_SERRU|nr:fimbrial protein [Serratia rubidaea]MBH1929655.1 fimbrial protein [Serratia rubidaea]MDC6118408.1 fimbrial protein [Serratia rubidaea]MEB7585200.1 fimbrial protein [Serratia rubidaea]VEI68364.1 putative fimbrial protein StiH [Serratia rubidaea]
MKILSLLSLIFLPLSVYAEPADTCWGDPVGTAVATVGKVSFTSNKRGAMATVKISAKPGSFSGFCHLTRETGTIRNNVRASDRLVSSEINPGYYKLNDDIDVDIYVAGYRIPFDATYPVTDIMERFTNLPIGERVPASHFSAAIDAEWKFKLRRDVIGGAIIIPPDVELYSAYPKEYVTGSTASRPMYRVKTSSSGQIIAVPPECSINQGNAIEVNFDNIKTTAIPDSVDKSDTGYVRNIGLNFSCNTNLTQDIQVRLVANPSAFSPDLIRSNKPRLGFVMKHNNQIVKPWGSFRSRLEGGKGQETITLAPVKAPELYLQGGPFSASATLIIQSL